VAAANLTAAQRAEAFAAWQAGQTAQAAQLWQEIINTDSRDDQSLKNLAIASEKLDRKPEALKHWRALAERWRQQLRTQSDDPRFRDRLLQLEQHLLRLMLETDQPEQKILGELDSALRLNPQAQQLRQQAVTILLEIGKAQHALRHIEALERQQGQSPDLLAQKGTAFDLLNKRPQARQAFERALELDPKHVLARTGLLVLLGDDARRAEQRRQYTRAMEICQEQLKFDQNYAPALAHLASLNFRLKQKREGKALIKRFIATAPDTPQIYVQAGAIYLTHKMTREAGAEFKKALKIEESAMCFLHIGLAYSECGKPKQALKYFDRAAELGDATVLLQIFIALLESGQILQAGKYADQALRKDPQHPLPHLMKALSVVSQPFLIMFDPGLLDQARRELDEAEQLCQQQPETAFLLDFIRAIKRDLEHTPAGLPPFVRRPAMDDDDFDDDDWGEGVEDTGPMPPEVWRKMYR
jgi:tetratricopeptide (TPR) repeat protein